MKNNIKIIFTVFILGLMSLSFSSFVSADFGDYSYLDVTLLNQDPDPAEQGEYLDLRWKIVKEGNEKMDDIQVHLNVEYPFFFDSSDSPDKVIGTWSGWSGEEEYYILHYKIRVDENALEDTYDVSLKINHDEYGSMTTRDYPIRVGDKKNPEFIIGQILTSPLKLVGDSEDNQMEINLENIGDETADNVRIDLKLPEGFTPSYGYSTRETLGSINSNSGKTGTFYFDVDENIIEGDYEGSVDVYYKESDDENNIYKVINLPLNISILGKPSFEIESFKTIPEEVKAGDEVKLIFSIKNVGTKEGDSVSIRAFKESSQPFDFNEKSDFVGKLKPGELGEAILTLDINNDASLKNHIMDVEIRSVYNDEVLIENETVNLRINESNPTYWIFVLIILVVIGGLIYFKKYKTRKK